MAKILFVSANPLLVTDLTQQLELHEDWEVCNEYTAETVFDAAVIDDEALVAQELHGKLRQTPLFLLWSGYSELPEDDGIQVIRKPFRLENLLDTLHSGINAAAPTNGLLYLRGCCLDLPAKEIRYPNHHTSVKLTEREVAIVKYLYKAQDKIVSKAELLAEVWGYNPEATTHTVETHIYRLRQKIEQDGVCDEVIRTEDNGYKLNLT